MARRLTSLYIASLGTVAFLALLGQAIVQSMLSQQTRDAIVIEIATVTEATYKRLIDTHFFEPRGMIQVKGRGEMATYWLKGKTQLAHTI